MAYAWLTAGKTTVRGNINSDFQVLISKTAITVSSRAKWQEVIAREHDIG